MLEAYVQTATLELEPGADAGALGAAVTVELCGHWEHHGPCRWPHHTDVETISSGRIEVRTVFAATATDEPGVRSQLLSALEAGRLDGPSGQSRWTLVDQAADDPTDAERDFAARQSEVATG